MFGDKLIIGHTINKMDSKGRLFIPSLTQVEPGESLILEETKFKNDSVLRLTAYKEYYNMIERLIILRDNSTSMEDFEKFTVEIEKRCFMLASLVNVDSQKRILIPSTTLERLGWSKPDTYQCDGVGNALLIRQKKQP